MAGKFIPNGDLDFQTVATAFARGIAERPADYGVSEADAAALSERVVTYETALALARHSGRSAAATATKEAARGEVERIIRRLASVIRASDTISAADKVRLGLRERTKKPKVTTVPNESPRLTFVRAHHEGSGATPEHELSFCARDFKARPPGGVRVELFVDLIAPDAEIPEYPGQTGEGGLRSRPFYLRSYTRSPIRLIPPMADVPMRVIYWARWADTLGNVGPFSATAVGWVEGGSHYRQTRVMHAHEARPLRVEVGEGRPSIESETVIVALMTAGQLSAGRMPAAQLSASGHALPDESRSNVRQLEGPISDAA